MEQAAQVVAETSGMLGDKNFAIAMIMMAAPSLAAFGIAWIGSSAVSAIGRNPEAGAKIQTVTILVAAFTEAIAIYSLVVALILKFV